MFIFFKNPRQPPLRDALFEIAPGSKKELFESTGNVDFGYAIPGLGRFRYNFFNH